MHAELGARLAVHETHIVVCGQGGQETTLGPARPDDPHSCGTPGVTCVVEAVPVSGTYEAGYRAGYEAGVASAVVTVVQEHVRALLGAGAPLLIDATEAATLLGITPMALRKRVSEGRIPARVMVRTGRRIQFRRLPLIEWACGRHGR